MQHNNKHGPSQIRKNTNGRKGQTVRSILLLACRSIRLSIRWDAPASAQYRHGRPRIGKKTRRRRLFWLVCFCLCRSAARSRDIIEEPLPLSLSEGGGNSLSASPSDVVYKEIASIRTILFSLFCLFFFVEGPTLVFFFFLFNRGGFFF